MIKAALILSVLLSQAALAREIVNCEDAGIGIRSLVTPIEKNSRGFYFDKSLDNHRVHFYNLDMVEPAAASSGIAIVMPDHESDVGDLKCLAIIYLTGTDVTRATSSYDATKGLLVTIPAYDYNESGEMKPADPLKIRVHLPTSSASLE